MSADIELIFTPTKIIQVHSVHSVHSPAEKSGEISSVLVLGCL